jgi:PAS domain S-box-containing protein
VNEVRNVASITKFGSATSVEELRRRPSRPPDHVAENQALFALVQELADPSVGILQKLAETALRLCRAGSAGISVLEDEDQRKNFHWRALVGQWASHLGGGTPRDFGPCGTVLDHNSPLLFTHPERDFPYLRDVRPLLEEGLLVPFYVDGEAVGTIWVVSHDATHCFDAEDLRLVSNLATFASAAYRTVRNNAAMQKADSELQKTALEMQRFSFIVESSDDAIISKNLDGIIQSWNKGAERIFGYTSEEAIGKPITFLMTPDRHEEEAHILECLRRGERVPPLETIRRRKDGTPINVAVTMSPVLDADGHVIGASKIARDITARRQAEEAQSLLLGEMRHRINNLFAITNSLVTLSARAAKGPMEMAAAVQQRLAALSRAQQLTRPGLIGQETKLSEKTTLKSLIRTIFAPYESEGSERIMITGCDHPINESSVTSVALLLHELATNAAKYGSLSTSTGLVHIDCSSREGWLVMIWKEQGGPSIKGPPDMEGFGGRLARQVVSNQFKGRISNEWNKSGLVIKIEIPLEQL